MLIVVPCTADHELLTFSALLAIRQNVTEKECCPERGDQMTLKNRHLRAWGCFKWMKAIRKLSLMEGKLLDSERLGCSGKRIGEAAGDIHSWKSVLSLKTHCWLLYPWRSGCLAMTILVIHHYCRDANLRVASVCIIQAWMKNCGMF